MRPLSVYLEGEKRGPPPLHESPAEQQLNLIQTIDPRCRRRRLVTLAHLSVIVIYVPLSIFGVTKVVDLFQELVYRIRRITARLYVCYILLVGA